MTCLTSFPKKLKKPPYTEITSLLSTGSELAKYRSPRSRQLFFYYSGIVLYIQYVLCSPLSTITVVISSTFTNYKLYFWCRSIHEMLYRIYLAYVIYILISRMRSSLARMRSSLARMRSSLAQMRSSLVVRTSDCQCTSCNGPGFGPSIRRQSGSEGRQMKQCWI